MTTIASRRSTSRRPPLALTFAAALALAVACDDAPRRPGGSGGSGGSGGGGGTMGRDATRTDADESARDADAPDGDAGPRDVEEAVLDLGLFADAADQALDAAPSPDGPARFDARPVLDASGSPDAFRPGDATPAADVAPVGSGACTNAADLAIITGQGPLLVAQAAFLCAFSGGCIPPTAMCVAPCVSMQTGLSLACSSCFAEQFGCALATCPSCIQSPSSQECTDCQATSRCGPQFDACSGLPPP